MKKRYLSNTLPASTGNKIFHYNRVEINSECSWSRGREEIYVSWGNDLKNRDRFLESVFMHTCYDFKKVFKMDIAS